MDADVIEMPVQAVLGERDHAVRLVALDREHDLDVKLRHVGPPQIAVRMVEDDGFGDTEDLRGFVQLAGAHAAEVAVCAERGIGDAAFFSPRRAQQHDPRTGVGETRDRPSTRQRLIVWMREHHENGAAGEVRRAGWR